jgi:hypothetical protein
LKAHPRRRLLSRRRNGALLEVLSVQDFRKVRVLNGNIGHTSPASSSMSSKTNLLLRAAGGPSGEIQNTQRRPSRNGASISKQMVRNAASARAPEQVTDIAPVTCW